MNDSELQAPAPSPATGSALPNHGELVPRGALRLLYFFCTLTPMLRFFWYTGLGLLPLALLGALWSRQLSFGLALYSYLALLVLPYMMAVTHYRMLIGNRRLSLLPGFALTSGLTLLLFTLAVSAFVPALARLLGIAAIPAYVAARIFIFISLFLYLIQLCQTSRRAAAFAAALPLLIALATMLINNAGARPRDTGGLWLLALLGCVLGWTLALWRLYRRTAFRPPFLRLENMSQSNDFSHFSTGAAWLFRYFRMPPAASLLLAYPASIAGRALNLGLTTLVSPLFTGLVMTLLLFRDNGRVHFTEALFGFHLFMVAMYPWCWGEYAARCRLLWLRTGGPREELWRLLEKELLLNYLLMFGFTLLLTLVLILAGYAASLPPPPYLLLTVALALHNGYMNIHARLGHWSTLQHLLYAIVQFSVLGPVVFFGLRGGEHRAVWLLSGVLLLLCWWFRRENTRGFPAVDWIRLKPARMPRGNVRS